jgi:flagellar basal body-associated protein FliL
MNSNSNSEFSSQIQLKSTEELFKPKRRCPKVVKYLLFVLVILLAVAGGFLLGFFLSGKISKGESNGKTTSTTQEYLEKFKNMIDPKELENNLRYCDLLGLLLGFP